MTREICEKGSTWTDWVPTLCGPSRSSRLSRSTILQAGPHADVQTVEILLCKKVFRSLLEREYTDRT
jgi:hypothetical protein